MPNPGNPDAVSASAAAPPTETMDGGLAPPARPLKYAGVAGGIVASFARTPTADTPVPGTSNEPAAAPALSASGKFMPVAASTSSGLGLIALATFTAVS